MLKKNQKYVGKEVQMEDDLNCVLSDKQKSFIHNLFNNIDYEICVSNSNYYMQKIIITTKKQKVVCLYLHVVSDIDDNNFSVLENNTELLNLISEKIEDYNEDLDALKSQLKYSTFKEDSKENLKNLLNQNSRANLVSIINSYNKISDDIEREFTLTELVETL